MKAKLWQLVLGYIFTCIWILFWHAPVGAGEPMNFIKRNVDEIIEVVSNTELDTQNKRKKVVEILDVSIDWKEVARRVLAIHWRRRTPPERQEFYTLFKAFVEDSYAKKFEKYSSETILYEKEHIEGDYATVGVKVITQEDQTISLLCKLFKRQRRWLIYDVLIEGVSMVNNYRVQINEVIVGSSYENLIKKLQTKQKSSS